jgi:hypothetical protein
MLLGAVAGCLLIGWTFLKFTSRADAPTGPRVANAQPGGPAPAAASAQLPGAEKARKEVDAAAERIAAVRARLESTRQGGAPLATAEIQALKQGCAEALRHCDRAFELDPSNREALAQRDLASRSMGEIEAAEVTLARADAARKAESRRLAAASRELVDEVSNRILAWERLPSSPPLSRQEAQALAAKCRSALRLADRAIALERLNKIAWVQKIRSYRLLEDYGRMNETMEAAFRVFRNDPVLVSLKNRLLPETQP